MKVSIRWQFLVFVVVLIGLVILSLGFYNLRQLQSNQVSNLDKRAELLLDNLNTIAGDAVIIEDLLSINDTARKYIEEEDIDYIIVYNNFNELMVYVNNSSVYNVSNQLTNSTDSGLVFSSEFSRKVLETNRSRFKFFNFAGKPPYLKLALPDNLFPDAQYIQEYSTPVRHYGNPLIDNQLGTIRLGINNRSLNQQLQKTQAELLLFTGIVLLIAIFMTALLTGFITQSIIKLTRGVQTVAAGDMEHHIDIKRGDEIGTLANEFNRMVNDLKLAQEQLVSKKLLERDVEVASGIQTSLLPKEFIQKGDLQMAGFSKAAKGVGGDYFDFLTIDKEHEAFVISDVSGKGIPAALIMVMLKTIFHVAAPEKITDTKGLCEIANRFLFANSAKNKFATTQYGVIHRESGKLTFTNSGHGDLYLYRRAKQDFEFINLKGLPIGMTPVSKYLSQEIMLERGDIIVSFTDGVSEARNIDGAEYGKDEVLNLIKECQDLDAKEITEILIERIYEFIGDAPPHDDLTLLTVKYGEV